MKPLHVLVVDDEPLAREALARELETRREVGRVTRCPDGVVAVERLLEGGVDLVFLDVQMPECDGFEVVRRVGVRNMPPLVFVTAHERFALPAFDVRALDYLLKPVTRARFEESFTRALARLETGPAPDAPGSLRIRLGGRTVLVRLDDVVWIEAANTYVRVHTHSATHLLRASLGALEERLDSARFLRIHRSAIVRTDAVRELRHLVRGDYELVLSNGDRVRASRRRRQELLERLGRDALS